MKIKILGNIEYQTIPITEDMVEVDDELLKRIGIDKQFDENGNIIDYVDVELQIYKLDNWFKIQYREYNEMLTRRKTLGIEDTIVDEFRNKTYHNIIELYKEAEVVAGEIRELRKNVK